MRTFLEDVASFMIDDKMTLLTPRIARSFSPNLILIQLTMVATSDNTTTPIAEGQCIPSVDFICRTRIESNDENPFDWITRTSDSLFKGKRIVLFSLPGKIFRAFV